MSYIVLKIEVRWANIFSTEVCKVEEWEKAKAALLSYADKLDGITYGYGTKQEVEFDSVDDLLNYITVIPIPDEFVEVAQTIMTGNINIFDLVNDPIDNIRTEEAENAFDALPEDERGVYKSLYTAVEEAGHNIWLVRQQAHRTWKLGGDEVNALSEGDPQSELWDIEKAAIKAAQDWWTSHGLYGHYLGIANV